MARKKTSGVRKVGDRQYEVDKIAIINGKRVHIHSSGYVSAQEAKDALSSLLDKKRKELDTLSTEKTFDDLIDQVVAVRRTKCKGQTVDAFNYMVGKHILPHFTGLAIPKALTYERVKDWYMAKCAVKGITAEHMNRVFSLMRHIIDCAWKWHYITSEAHQDLESLVENIRLPNKAKSDKEVWTYEQEQAFLSAIPQDSIDYPMFALFCYLGCRLGEFQALQWKCFDQENGIIAIGQQVVRVGGGTIVTGELKTNESYRVNELDTDTLALMVKYRETLNSSEDDEFMFPSPYSSKEPLSRTEFRRRFNKYIELSGVPKIVVHGVRKSKATMLAGVCQNAEEVAVGAKFLGHSPSMFMGTYVSQTGLKQSELIKRLKGAKA